MSIKTEGISQGMDVWGIDVITKNDDGFVGRSAGDAILKIDKVGDNIDLSDIYALRVTAQVPEGTSMRIFFTTSSSSEWSHDKSVPLVADSSEMKEYLFVMSGVNDWNGTLMGLRFDPIDSNGDIFTVKTLELLSLEGQSPKKMTINGMTFDTNFSAQTAPDGDVLVAFDPACGMDFRLNAFHIWDKADRKLTLNFIEHTVIYTVGSDKYTVDGVEKSLGYALPEIDGLPLIPIKKLCEEIGYTYIMGEDGIISIDTDQKSYFEADENTSDGSWEFEKPGDSEGWSSVLMNVYTVNDYMTCVSLTDSTDPIVWSATDLFMPAEKYTKLNFRVRYNYVADDVQPMVIYFITDRDQNWSEDKSLRVILNSTNSNGEWEEYSVETASNPMWKDNIIRLRFDPFNAPSPSSMDVDYIRFDENPDYVYVAPKLSIVNGDAEDESKADVFVSENADIEIYKDSVKGNVWRLNPRPEQAWVYIRQSVRYTAGARYKVTVDVKVNGTLTSEDVTAQIYYNAIYTDSVGKTDHNELISNKGIQVSDGWKTYTFEFQIPEDALLTGEQQFAFYANPIAEESVGYMIDNLVIEQLD